MKRIERILSTPTCKQLYNIDLSNEEFDDLNKKNKESFTGTIIKGNYKTLGFLEIKSQQVYCMFSHGEGCFVACLLKGTEENIMFFIKAVFRKSLWHTAFAIYKEYLIEKEKVKNLVFNSKKEAAQYFFAETLFPNLHISDFEGEVVDNKRILSFIEMIIEGKSQSTEISLKRKTKFEGNFR